MKNKLQIKIIVHGMVQGVFYRASTQKTALGLGVKGWVKNMPDRTVHALLQGEHDILSQMITWCKKGPPASQVDHVETKRQDLTTEYDTFEIMY